MKNKTLIITGMHRSGTSVITQWLQRSGLHIGNVLLGPAAGNEDGHFEDNDFVQAHEEILRQSFFPRSGLTFHSLPDLLQSQIEKLQGLINDKQAIQTEWGWKDPRTCLFLPVYRHLLPDAFYLIIIRDPVASVSSLINRRYLWLRHKNTKSWFRRWKWEKKKAQVKEDLYKKYSEYYLKVWIRYNKNFSDHIKTLKDDSFLVVSYDSLNRSDKIIYQHMKDKWDFNLTYVDFKTIFKDHLLNLPVDIDAYITDKQLFLEADFLYQTLKNKEKKEIKENVLIF